MTHHGDRSESTDRAKHLGSHGLTGSDVRDLYGDPHFLSGHATANGDSKASYLDLSGSPYSGDKFDHQHPWRAHVINKDEQLHKELKHDAGHLGGHYDQLNKRINAVYRDEETEASENGGHLTEKEYTHLLARERHINRDMNADYHNSEHGKSKKHGSHKHHPGSSEPPTGSPEPPTGSPEPPTGPPEPPTGPPEPPTGPPEPTNGKVVIGAAFQPGDFGASSQEQALVNFDQKTGFNQGIQMMYINQNLGKTPDVAAMQNDVKNGVIPMLSLRTIDYADVASGRDDAYLQKVANDLKQVNGTVYLRPNWEMDGGQRQQFGTPQDFIKSWQYMHDFMQKAGVTNVKWVWTPDSAAFDSKVPSWSSSAKEYYPGSQYVDLIGADGYSGIKGAAYQTPDQIFDPGLQFAEQQGKPFVIGETGVNSSFGAATDAKYMQQMTSFIENNSDVQYVSWFSEGNNNVFSSPQEAAAFTKMEEDVTGQSA